MHHLLVELADPRSVGPGVHGVLAAVRDRPAREQRDPPRALSDLEHVGLAIPVQPRAQLGEVRRRIAAGEHVEHRLEEPARQRREALRPRQHRLEFVDGDRPLGDDRHDLLREHVQRMPRHGDLLDRALAHALRDDRGLEQIAAMLREDDAAAGLADGVPGAADPLQPARDRAGTLDQQHEIDALHVDPELEARRRYDRAQLALRERLLDLLALVVGQRAVVRAHEGRRLVGTFELVQAMRQTLA